MSKRKKVILILLPILLIVLVSGAFFIFLSPFGKNLFKKNVRVEPSEASQSTESSSAFGNLNKKPESGLSNEDIEKMKNMDAVRNNALANPTNQAFNFLGANRIAQKDKPGSDPVLDYGEILLEVDASNAGKGYRVVASNNSFYKHSVGDVIPFDFTFNRTFFMVQGADKGISHLYERENYNVPDSLSVGDRIVIICQMEDCSDGALSWAFVYKTYEL